MEFSLNISETLRAGESRYLWALVVLFIVLGLGYSLLTPVFENSDETLHYPYAKHLADGRGLPRAMPNQLWGQEGTQPPLYYALVAASTFWIDTDNLSDHLRRNPHWLFTEVRSLINDNQNLVLHGPMDAFPYRRVALAVHLGRWWSLVFGLITVICTFRIARYFFSANLALALTATALTALNPQFIRVSTTVSNDSLAAAVAAVTVVLALKFTAPQAWPAGRLGSDNQPTHLPSQTYSFLAPLVLGLLCGLALLTKLSSLTTFFLAAYIIFWRIFFVSETHQQPFQKMIRWLLIIIGTMVVLSGWWFVRNFQLYGEWLAVDTHLSLAGGRGYLTLADVWSLRVEAARAYWATFGWGQIRPPEWIFQLLRRLVGIGLLGLALALLAKLVQGQKSRPLPLNLSTIKVEPVIFLVFWAGLNVVLYVRWVMVVGSVSHTRLIFPAISAISILLALGWHALLPRRGQKWVTRLVTAGLISLNIYSLAWLIGPAFQPSQPAFDQTDEMEIFDPLGLTFLDRFELVAGTVYPGVAPPPTPGRRPAAVSPGDPVTISVRWNTLAPVDKNYSVSALLLAPDGTVLARRETYPGLGLRPTGYLAIGETFIDTYPLQIDGDVSEPVVARAVVNLFDFDSETRTGLSAADPLGTEVTPLVGWIKVVPKTWAQHQPGQTVHVNFADAIALVGYDLNHEADGAKLTLYWESIGQVDEDYNLFIHLLDGEGNTIAQADAPPTYNAYPTSWWAPGETIADVRLLPPAPDVTHLRLGLYDLATGERLVVSESTLPQQDDGVEIALP
jgi:hypothetical protein